MNNNKQGMFVLPDGRNVLFTFCLVSSLFLLWGFCNGMIDVMDKHFQDELHLSLSQSAWVQFAHWMGYFLMSLPAGWLATRLGYKGGIIAGLLLVAAARAWALINGRPMVMPEDVQAVFPAVAGHRLAGGARAGALQAQALLRGVAVP